MLNHFEHIFNGVVTSHFEGDRHLVIREQNDNASNIYNEKQVIYALNFVKVGPSHEFKLECEKAPKSHEQQLAYVQECALIPFHLDNLVINTNVW